MKQQADQKDSKVVLYGS